MSQAKRAIEAGKQYKKYLSGYIAAYVNENVSGDNHFFIEESRNDPKIFKSKKAALKAISEIELSRPSKRYVRPYVYITSIPKHAKGLKLLSEYSDEELSVIEFVK